MELLLGFVLGLLAMSVGVYSQSGCLQNVPPFLNQRDRPRLPNRIQAIVPTYTFGCYGRVFRWGACVEPAGGRNARYNIDFQVWRPQPPGQESFFSLLGSNSGRKLRPSSSRCVTLDVSENEQIEIEPGDVVGFYFEHSRTNRDGGVEVDDSAVGVTTWYEEEAESTCPLDSDTCEFSIGTTGNLQSSETGGAPVITAAVEVLVPPVPTTVAAAPTNREIVIITSSTVPESTNSSVAATPTNRGLSSSHIVIIASSTVSDSATVISTLVVNDFIRTPTALPLSATVQTTESILQPSSNLRNIIQTSLQDVTVTSVRPGQSSVRSIIPNTSQSVSLSLTTDNPGSDSSQSSSLTGIVAGVVVGMLFTAFAISAIVMVVIIIGRKQRRVTGKKSRDFGSTLENPLYTGAISGSERHPPLTVYLEVGNNGSPHYEPLPQDQAQPYEIPSKVDIYATLSSEATLTSTSYGKDTWETVKSHDEWDIYVPTSEQRRTLNAAGRANGPGEIPWGYEGGAQDHVYAILEKETSLESAVFFQESAFYWSPSCDQSQLYDQLSSKKYREISRYQIHTTEELGSGHFGTVSRGVWQSKLGSVDVAVKTLRTEASEKDEVRFLQEAAINGQFKHPNIVKLLGVVTVGKPVMIVLELLPNGDLRNYLSSLFRAGESLPASTPRMLLGFCKQVASGMEYLSSKAFVHRDLAARNILVAKDRTCKISDFGMSRDLENESYYISQGGKIPIRWTAPEAIYFKKYSTASDVWSYGAVMYEIWSMGHKPFDGYTNQQVMTLASTEFRLPPPPGAPKEIYRLMINCWHRDKSFRPSFTEVVEALSEPEIDLLCWSEEDTAVHPQAAVLGAPLEAGLDLYPELQGTYIQ